MGETAAVLTMPVYQSEILDASDVCSNCFGRQRRDAVRPRQYKDDDTYSERCRWQTSVEDVPGPVVHDAGHLFCDCGAHGAHARIWSGVWHDCDIDRERLAELAKTLYHTLDAKGHQLDPRVLGREARNQFERFPRADRYTRVYGPDIRDVAEDQPTCINDVFERAVEAALVDAVETAPKATA